MRAELADPVAEGVPPGWDAFVEAAGWGSLWSADLLTALAWCAQTPTLLGLVSDAGRPVAAFHARVLGPTDPGSYAAPGRTGWPALVECRLHPTGSLPGHLFAAALDAAGRRAAVDAFEAAVWRRLRLRRAAVAYRQGVAGDLPAVVRRGRPARAFAPSLALVNRWPTEEAYLDHLDGRRRAGLRKARLALADVAVEWSSSAPAGPVAALAYSVRTRHVRPGWVVPPAPVEWFRLLNARPDVSFLRYADADGRLLGVSVLHEVGDGLLASIWAARDPADGGRQRLYFDQCRRMVELMVRTGRSRLELGKGMPEVKTSMGAVPTARYTVAGVR